MKKISILLSFATILFSACSKDDDKDTSDTLNGQTVLTFDSKVGSDDFTLNKDVTINGATYNFTQLRYWVSNVTLTNTDGNTYKVPSSYYLLEENNAIAVQDGSFEYPATKREDVTISDIPAGTYKSITFSIGIDAVYNDNLSLQAGELSQLNGMTNVSWMWHTSYIFSSLKGTRNSTAIAVETGLNTNYRTITITLPGSVTINAASTTNIKFSVDVTKIIDGLDLATTPTIGASVPAVMTQVADNYSTKAITATTIAK
ncbi:MAG: hypothetical protein H6Q26_33 [Bacteroidetes bacterium]|uniref:MbnP family protein n=1 Tax=Chitinophaga TaxID=79328 RepID=UPI0009D221FB|nr:MULTISPECIES: MbnP family protein [Chitinophaga]MBP1649876.1 hypothetical protein [Bacteroidota bacterium]OMP79265.1 hypothetical protein BW716_10425 [[Flexibacter] sp. ATCC 35208]WPQ66195.1 MbnP family protein [Chitinophaga sancti]WPV63780.1 hypothetical protein QQL36_18445 [Chitinophaga sp. LS1]